MTIQPVVDTLMETSREGWEKKDFFSEETGEGDDSLVPFVRRTVDETCQELSLPIPKKKSEKGTMTGPKPGAKETFSGREKLMAISVHVITPGRWCVGKFAEGPLSHKGLLYLSKRSKRQVTLGC